MTAPLRVLVVGASVAGPTAAYWFARAGATVTVIERAETPRAGGQNVDIRTAGVAVMRRMPGVEAAVHAHTTSLSGISFVRGDGREYGTIRATGDPDRQSLVSEYEIFRGHLARILVGLTERDGRVRYVYGEQVAGMYYPLGGEEGPVTVEFANGRLPTAEYDLVVACDGATSRMRAMGLGHGARDHVHPVNCWAAYFSIKQDILKGSTVGQSYSSPRGLFIGVGPDPAGGNRVGLMCIHPSETTQPFREAAKQGDDVLKSFVAKRYERAGWRTDEIMAGMMASEDFYANEMVQIKLPTLSRGRFVLVGDAGYACGPTGGGTTLAMAGAYILAGEIATGKYQGDIAAGLSGYEEKMRPLVTDMQKIPPLMPGIMAPQSAWGLWLRNNIFAFIAWTRILEIAQRFFAGAFASTEAYPLPEYEWEFQEKV